MFFHASCGFGIKRFLLRGVQCPIKSFDGGGVPLYRFIALTFMGLHFVHPLSTGAAGVDLGVCLGQGQTTQDSQQTKTPDSFGGWPAVGSGQAKSELVDQTVRFLQVLMPSKL